MSMEEIARAQMGSERALASLMRRHAPLVQALAMRFEEVQDAFQAGCIGLMKAIRGFDEKKGYAFSTYAVPVILGEMRKTREKRFGWRLEKKLRAANIYRDEMMKQFGREPTLQEMAERAQLPLSDMLLLMERTQTMQYDEDGYLLPSIPDPKGEYWMDRLLIRDILDRMPYLYSDILRRRYVYEESQVQVARRLHIHQSSLSRAEKKARLMFASAWQG